MHALPSVAPVTATPGPAFDPAISTNWTASMLSPSVCPPSGPTISPLLRLTTRTPPAAPPTTASVDEGFTPSEVMPSRLKRASSGESLKIGVGDRGSQSISNPSAQAVMMRLPNKPVSRVSSLVLRFYFTIRSELATIDSTSMTHKDLHRIPRRNYDRCYFSLNKQRRKMTDVARAIRLSRLSLQAVRCPWGAISRTVRQVHKAGGLIEEVGPYHDFIRALQLSQEFPSPVVFSSYSSPYSDLAVHSARGDHLAIGTPCCTCNTIGVSCQFHNHLAVGYIPDVS